MAAMEGVSYLLFGVYLFSFFLMSAVTAHQAGKPVWLFGKGGEPQALPALLFKFAFSGAALFPVLRALFGDPWRGDPIRGALDGMTTDVIGHLLVAVGACIAIISQLHMGASWRIGAADGELGPIVADGPFAWSRNPVFVGQAILFVGLFLVFPGVIQLLLTFALFVAITLQVRIEERVLERHHGDAYRDYCRAVPRWLGRAG